MYLSGFDLSAETTPFTVPYYHRICTNNQRVEENGHNNNNNNNHNSSNVINNNNKNTFGVDSVHVSKTIPPLATFSKKIWRRIQEGDSKRNELIPSSSFSFCPYNCNNGNNTNKSAGGCVSFVNCNQVSNTDSGGNCWGGVGKEKNYEYMKMGENGKEKKIDEKRQITMHINDLSKSEIFKKLTTDFISNNRDHEKSHISRYKRQKYLENIKIKNKNKNFNKNNTKYYNLNNLTCGNNCTGETLKDFLCGDKSTFGCSGLYDTKRECLNFVSAEKHSTDNSNNNDNYYVLLKVKTGVNTRGRKNFCSAKKAKSVFKRNKKKRLENRNVKWKSKKNERKQKHHLYQHNHQQQQEEEEKEQKQQSFPFLSYQSRCNDDVSTRRNQLSATTTTTKTVTTTTPRITPTMSRLNELRERISFKGTGQSYTNTIDNTLTTANNNATKSSLSVSNYFPLSSTPSYFPPSCSSYYSYPFFQPTLKMEQERCFDNQPFFGIGESYQHNAVVFNNNNNIGTSNDVYFQKHDEREVVQPLQSTSLSSSSFVKKKADVIEGYGLPFNIHKDSEALYKLKERADSPNNKNNGYSNSNNNCNNNTYYYCSLNRNDDFCFGNVQSEMRQKDNTFQLAKKSVSPKNVSYDKNAMIHVVFDTSSLLDADNAFLNKVSKEKVVCIPFDVITELDALNSNSNSSNNNNKKGNFQQNVKKTKEQEKKERNISFRSRQVRDWIISALEGKNDCNVRVQRRCEVELTYDRKVATKDDSILGFAVFLEQHEHLNVEFVTNDKFLLVKAVSELKGNVYSLESKVRNEKGMVKSRKAVC